MFRVIRRAITRPQRRTKAAITVYSDYVKGFLRALVIDDEIQVSNFIAQVLKADGWDVTEAHSAEEAFKKLDQRSWALVFCDVVLGGVDGYTVLRRFSELQADARFILMTGHGSAAGALDATSNGAYDYLTKPFSVDDILKIAANVREQSDLRTSEKNHLHCSIEPLGYQSELRLIGNSAKFVECLKLVGRVSSTNLPVLITGESGTGKEVVARAIHQRSRHSDGPFVSVNCGALPTDLIESELFGHARGAFTGADRERIGLWEEASGGTLLLDEITETTPHFQVKLLRALQEGEIRRVGSNQTIKVDVRIIAASNRDIENEIEQGRFRRDLMYRLNAVTIQLPALRERIDDVVLLANHFAKTVGFGRAHSVKFSSAALNALNTYDWPGNIRELENAMLHAVTLSDDVIYPEHLPATIRNHKTRSENGGETGSDTGSLGPTGPEVWPELSVIEQRYVRRVLEHTNGNKQAAARILDIDRKTLSRIIARESLPDTEQEARIATNA